MFSIFSSLVSWFYYLILYKPQQRNLDFWTYFSVNSFFCSAVKEGFQTHLFKTQVLTQPDFENPRKIHFKPEKGRFWFTLKGPRSAYGWKYHWFGLFVSKFLDIMKGVFRFGSINSKCSIISFLWRNEYIFRIKSTPQDIPL